MADPKDEAPKPEMTMKEAARLGGAATRERYSHEHFQEIGRQGGTTTWIVHGRAHYQAMGRKGTGKGRPQKTKAASNPPLNDEVADGAEPGG